MWNSRSFLRALSPKGENRKSWSFFGRRWNAKDVGAKNVAALAPWKPP